MCTVDVWQSAMCVRGGVTEHDGHASCQCSSAFAREGLGGQGPCWEPALATCRLDEQHMQKNLDFIPGKPRRSEGPLLGEGSPVPVSEESLVTVRRAEQMRGGLF